jgi:hypothetical protein
LGTQIGGTEKNDRERELAVIGLGDYPTGLLGPGLPSESDALSDSILGDAGIYGVSYGRHCPAGQGRGTS